MANGAEERTPIWAAALAGAVLLSALAPRAPPAAAREPELAPSLAASTARELRRVPGLGERRSLALVDARWGRSRADPPLYLGDVPGVGPVSEAQVAVWLAATGAASALRVGPSADAAYTRAAAARDRDPWTTSSTGPP